MKTEDRETLRHATLEALALRHPAALSLGAVARAVRKELAFPFEETDLASALEMLKGLGLTQSLPDPFGASQCWCATANGVLHFERNGGR